MAKGDLGTKRACLACGMKFYDFNRSPILCPGCGAEFDSEMIVKKTKARSANKVSSVTEAGVSDDAAREEDQSDELSETIVVDKEDDDIIFEEDDVDVDVDEDGPGIIQDDISDDNELLPNLDDKEDSQVEELSCGLA